MDLNDITDLLPPEAWAAYLVGIIGGLFIINQVRYNLRLNKKDVVFQEIIKKIEEARQNFDALESDKQRLVNELARLANYYSAQQENKASSKEYQNTLTEINNLYDVKTQHISSLYTLPKNIMEIIKEIEKSTFLNSKCKQMARVLFYAYNDQFKLMQVVNDVLSTINVIPSPGQSINITPDTFNNFINLVHHVYNENTNFRSYLDDLEVEIHNSLVRQIYGKARKSNFPNKHLVSDGFEDVRKDSSLI